MRSAVSKGLWALGAVLSVAIAVYSYRYLLPSNVVGGDIAANLMRRPWLLVHASLASTALIVGPFQFLPRLRARFPRAHRIMGRVYVFACLVGGAAGFLLAMGTDAGPIAQAGFGILAILWVAAAGQAWRLAMAGRIAEHRQWMIRSFALTFAAVTLRLYLPVILLSPMSFMDGYRAVSWLSWVLNLLVAELYIRGKLRPARRIPADRVVSVGPV